MSFVTTQPELLTSAAANLGGIGAAMTAGNMAAAAPTTGVVPAAADEVSALTAVQFAAHAEMYQAVERPSRGDSRDCLRTRWVSAPGRMRPPRPPTRPRRCRQLKVQPWISEPYHQKSTPRGCIRGQDRRPCWPPRAAWDTLAAELQSGGIVLRLGGLGVDRTNWQGPSSWIDGGRRGRPTWSG